MKTQRRASRPAPGARTIDLSRDKGAAFWQLRARVADVQRAEHLAQQAMAAVQQARGVLSQHLAELGAEHGFDAASHQFRLDDASLSIHLTPEAPQA